METEKKDGPSMDPMPKSKGSGGSKMIMLGVLVLACGLCALVVGGLVFAFFSNRNIPVFSGAVEKVERVALTEDQEAEVIEDNINDFVFSMLASSADSTTLINADYTKEEAESYLKGDAFELKEGNLNADVSLESKDATVDLNMSGFFSEDGMDMKLTGNMASADVTLDIKGEFRQVGDKLYLNIEEFPFEAYGLTGMDAVKNQWIYADMNSAESLGEGLTGSSLTSSGTSITSDDLKKIQEFIYSDAMTNTLTREDDKVIDGVRTNCFTMYIGEEEMGALLKEMGELAGEEEITEDELESLTAGMDSMQVYMCMGRIDGNIYEGKITYTYGTAGIETTLELEFSLTDHNNVDKKVEEPSDAVDLETLITQVYMQMQGGSLQSLTGDSSSQQDLEEYEDLLQMYEGQGYDY